MIFFLSVVANSFRADMPVYQHDLGLLGPVIVIDRSFNFVSRARRHLVMTNLESMDVVVGPVSPPGSD